MILGILNPCTYIKISMGVFIHHFHFQIKKKSYCACVLMLKYMYGSTLVENFQIEIHLLQP